MKKHFVALVFGPAGGMNISQHKKCDTREEAEAWAKEQIRNAKVTTVGIYEFVGGVQTKIDFEVIPVVQ